MNISRAAYETDPGIVLMCSMVRSLGWMCLQKCDISPINICALINAGNLNEVFVHQASISCLSGFFNGQNRFEACFGIDWHQLHRSNRIWTLDSGRPVHWPPEYNENCWLKSNISGQALILNMLTKWTLHFCINRATYLALSQSICPPPPKKWADACPCKSYYPNRGCYRNKP